MLNRRIAPLLILTLVLSLASCGKDTYVTTQAKTPSAATALTTTSTTTTTEPPTTTEAPTTTTSTTVPEPATTTTRLLPPPTMPPSTYPPTAQEDPGVGVGLPAFLVCVRRHESGGNYGAVNPSSGAGGAFQFLPSTWQSGGFAAKYGVSRAEYAAAWQQDEAAITLYANGAGRGHWNGSGC